MPTIEGHAGFAGLAAEASLAMPTIEGHAGFAGVAG
jgi:hypothetical protein